MASLISIGQNTLMSLAAVLAFYGYYRSNESGDYSYIAYFIILLLSPLVYLIDLRTKLLLANASLVFLYGIMTMLNTSKDTSFYMSIGVASAVTLMLRFSPEFAGNALFILPLAAVALPYLKGKKSIPLHLGYIVSSAILLSDMKYSLILGTGVALAATYLYMEKRLKGR